MDYKRSYISEILTDRDRTGSIRRAIAAEFDKALARYLGDLHFPKLALEGFQRKYLCPSLNLPTDFISAI